MTPSFYFALALAALLMIPALRELGLSRRMCCAIAFVILGAVAAFVAL